MKKNKEKNPFDWENITIEKYYKIKDILDDEVDDDITKNVKLVAVMLNKDEQEVWDMDMAEAGNYISRLQFLNKFELVWRRYYQYFLYLKVVHIIQVMTSWICRRR